MIMKKGKIFTIGHSVHEAGFFAKLLLLHDCKIACDVRAFPYSQYCPQFQRDSMEKYLPERGLKYWFLGRELGGRSADPSHYINGRLQYDLLSESLLFQAGLEKIIKAAASQNIALVCAEKNPLLCHRMLLVCRALRQKQAFPEERIGHIMPDGSLKTNREAEAALLEKWKLRPDMLRTSSDCLKEAYRLQAQKTAHSIKKSSGRGRPAAQPNKNRPDMPGQLGLFS